MCRIKEDLLLPDPVAMDQEKPYKKDQIFRLDRFASTLQSPSEET
jgi:hypothetical protein